MALATFAAPSRRRVCAFSQLMTRYGRRQDIIVAMSPMRVVCPSFCCRRCCVIKGDDDRPTVMSRFVFSNYLCAIVELAGARLGRLSPVTMYNMLYT